MNSQFLFATGIENSNPTILNGRLRVDELEKCGHYTHWRKDFDLVENMGIQFLRYRPPIHTTWLGHDRFDWSFTDETFRDLRRRNIVPIVDLCHFGLIGWAIFRIRIFRFCLQVMPGLSPNAFHRCSFIRPSMRYIFVQGFRHYTAGGMSNSAAIRPL